MNSSVLKDILVNKKPIPQFMVFIEDEPTNAKAYLNLISKNLNKPVKFYYTANEAIYDITTALVDDRIYYIVNDEKLFKNSNYVAALKQFEENIIIAYDGIKIPEQFLDENKSFTYVFSKGDMNTLFGYVSKKAISNKINITQYQIKDLIEKSDYKLSQIENEISKLSLLSNEQQIKYLANREYPNITKPDNMNIMLKIIDNDKSAIQYADVLCENAVGSLKAIYTMAKKRFLARDYSFYAKLMILTFKYYNAIIDGSMNTDNAIKKFLIDVF